MQCKHLMTDTSASHLSARFSFLFSCLDRDGDGRIEKSDVLQIGESLRAERGWVAGDASWTAIVAALEDFWFLLALCVDADGSGDISCAEFEVFHVLMADQTVEFSGQPPPWATTLFSTLLQTLDADHDGQVRLEEYAIFLRAMGSTLDPAQAFARLDMDGSGGLDLREIERLLTEYLTDESPEAPGAWLLTGGVPHEPRTEAAVG